MQQRSLFNLLALLIAVVSALALVDRGAKEIFQRQSRVIAEPLDIQSPASLFAKTCYLAERKEKALALFGDSVALGKTMQEHGDRSWRAHTFDALLAGDFKFDAVNFGMNGATVEDLEKTVGLGLTASPRVILITMNLAYFSADFSKATERQSRPWLQQTQFDGERGFSIKPTTADLRERVENWFAGFFVNHWYLYQIRDILQDRLLGGRPLDRAAAAAQFLNEHTQFGATEDGLTEDELQLLRVKKRYLKIDLSSSSPQVQALIRLLSELRNRQQKSLIFYTPENESVVSELMDRQNYDLLRTQLEHLIAPFESDRLIYLAKPVNGPSDDYLDHIHMNENGYRRFTTQNLSAVVQRLWATP